MKYEGNDWTELSKQFGVFEKELSDDIILQRTKDYLVAKHFSDTEYLANEIRHFLNCLYEKCNGQKFNAPIWRGLLEVTDDFTLVKYTIILLEHMWY